MNLAVVNEAVTEMNGVEHQFTEEEKNFVVQFAFRSGSKENSVDWNDQKYAEVWRHSWETITNRYLEAAGRPERVDLRSFERQGIQQIPTIHLGPAAHQMEKRGVETFLGNLNRDIRAANSLMQSIRSAIRGLQRWIAYGSIEYFKRKNVPTPAFAFINFVDMSRTVLLFYPGTTRLNH